MPNSRAVETRDLGDEELRIRLKESKEELFNLRFQVATGQLDNNRRLQTVRRDIARIYTVMRERELGISYASAPIDSDLPSAATTEAPEEAGATA